MALTTAQEQYLTDEMYTPISYKGKMVSKPVYLGADKHSDYELENICKQFQDYCEQQEIIKQNVMKHLVEIKYPYLQSYFGSLNK